MPKKRGQKHVVVVWPSFALPSLLWFFFLLGASFSSIPQHQIRIVLMVYLVRSKSVKSSNNVFWITLPQSLAFTKNIPRKCFKHPIVHLVLVTNFSTRWHHFINCDNNRRSCTSLWTNRKYNRQGDNTYMIRLMTHFCSNVSSKFWRLDIIKLFTDIIFSTGYGRIYQ